MKKQKQPLLQPMLHVSEKFIMLRLQEQRYLLMRESSANYRDVMTAAEQLRQEGLNIGRSKERHELAQKMLAAGLDKELVEKIINSEVKESSNS